MHENDIVEFDNQINVVWSTGMRDVRTMGRMIRQFMWVYGTWTTTYHCIGGRKPETPEPPSAEPPPGFTMCRNDQQGLYMDDMWARGGAWRKYTGNWLGVLENFGWVYGTDELFAASKPAINTTAVNVKPMWNGWPILKWQSQPNKADIDNVPTLCTQVAINPTELAQLCCEKKEKESTKDYESRLDKFTMENYHLLQWASCTALSDTAFNPDQGRIVNRNQNQVHIECFKTGNAQTSRKFVAWPSWNALDLNFNNPYESNNKVTACTTDPGMATETCPYIHEKGKPWPEHVKHVDTSNHHQSFNSMLLVTTYRNNKFMTSSNPDLYEIARINGVDAYGHHWRVQGFNGEHLERSGVLTQHACWNVLPKHKLTRQALKDWYSGKLLEAAANPQIERHLFLRECELFLYQDFYEVCWAKPATQHTRPTPGLESHWNPYSQHLTGNRINLKTAGQYLHTFIPGPSPGTFLTFKGHNSGKIISHLTHHGEVIQDVSNLYSEKEAREYGYWFKTKPTHSWKFQVEEGSQRQYAVGIPVGEGKSHLANRHPEIFTDHDNLLDQSVHAKLQTNQEALKGYQKSVKHKKPWLLTWGSDSTPKNHTFIGYCLLKTPPQDTPDHKRNELQIQNRQGALEDTEAPIYWFNTREQRNDWLLKLTQKPYPQTDKGAELLTINSNHQAVVSALSIAEEDYIYMPYIEPVGSAELNFKGEEQPVIPIEKYHFWEEDTLPIVRKGKPTNYMTGKPMKTWELPCGVIKQKKKTMEPYPAKAYPVLTRMVYAEQHAVANVLCSATVYRKVKLDPKIECRKFAQAYFSENWSIKCQQYRNNALTFDENKITEWLSKRTGIKKIDQEIDTILSEGMYLHPPNKVNVHVKLESLLKSSTINSFTQQAARIIVWQQKGLAALFASIFLEAKQRLKTLLNHRVVYADGLDPMDLSARVRAIQETAELKIIEDDLTKQDRQTDWQTLDVEMEIYRQLLGVHPEVVQLWRIAHKNWYLKGGYIKGTLDGMRLTGQVTTALGNAIVNMLVHRRLAERLGKDLQLMLVLGDDNLIITPRTINARTMRKEIRDLWNMESKMEQYDDTGIFLRWMCHKDMHGKLNFGPDICRLRHRFSVTNNDKETDMEHLHARNMSYCMMLGDCRMTRRICSKHNYDLNLPTFYDELGLLNATAKHYKTNTADIEEQWHQLEKMMTELKVHEYEFEIFTGPKFGGKR